MHDKKVQKDIPSIHEGNRDWDIIDEELVADIKSRMILHWNYRNLTEIPAELLQSGNHIQEIYLKRNNLTSLPRDIGKLCSLTNLYLMGNGITSIPPEIENLHNLKVLDLTANRLESICKNIGNLTNLEQLLLCQNELSLLPKEFGQLKSLKRLWMSGNKLTNLPHEVIQGLESLEELAIDRNPITSLPRNIVSLKNLVYISACKCKLQYLPAIPFNCLINNGRRSHTGNYSSELESHFQNDNDALSTNGYFRFLFDSNPDLNYLPFWIVQLMGSDIEIFGCGINLLGGIIEEDKICTNKYSRFPKIGFKYQGQNHTLCFDDDLMKIHSEISKEPPSLLELCLRQVYIEGLHQNPKCPLKDSQEPKPQIQNSNPALNSKIMDKNFNYVTMRSGMKSKSPEFAIDVEIEESRTWEVAASQWGQPPPLLPQNLSLILEKAAVSRCFQCLKPIFTEMWLNLFTVSPNQRLNQAAVDNIHVDLNPQANVGHQGELIDANFNLPLPKLSCIYLCSKSCQSTLYHWLSCNPQHYLTSILKNKIEFSM